MKVMTMKLSPKMIFGLILITTGIVVVLITFFSNHVRNNAKSASAQVSCATEEERKKYLTDMGWELGEATQKELTIPSIWSDVYKNYNDIQIAQGCDLTDYKGKTVTLYTYEIINYDKAENGVVADLLVSDGMLIGGDICNTSAKDGFLHGFEKKDEVKT